MKSGYQTSEFGLSITTIVGLLVSAGVVQSSDAEALIKFIDALIAFISAMAIAIAYMQQRSKLKEAAIKQAQLPQSI